MIHATVPAFIALIGALVYAFAPPKAAELGKLAFFAGLLVALVALEHAGVSLP